VTLGVPRLPRPLTPPSGCGVARLPRPL